VKDQWVWKLHFLQCYTVNGAYNNLTEAEHNIYLANNYVLWLKVVQLKSYYFAWRLLFKRVPTKDNLVRREGFLV